MGVLILPGAAKLLNPYYFVGSCAYFHAFLMGKSPDGLGFCVFLELLAKFLASILLVD